MKQIAVVGATGLVGQKLLQLLQGMPNVRLRLFGNSSVGQKVAWAGRTLTVEECRALLDAKPDYALFMANEEVAARYAPKLAARGTVCIDNSTRFRLRPGVPLVVPCVNGEAARGHNLIANPNCSTVQVAIAVNALKALEPTRMTAVTYQSVSGAGRDGLEDWTEARGYGRLKCFRHPIADNLIPLIGDVRPDGFSTEERKLTDESRKILSLPRLKVNAFCVRVPLSVCHGAFVNLQLKRKFTLEEVRRLLKNAPNVLLLDDAACGLYPMPITVRNTRYVAVGRVTKDPTANAVNFFCVADNLLRGAAYNAYEILQCKLQEAFPCL